MSQYNSLSDNFLLDSGDLFKECLFAPVSVSVFFKGEGRLGEHTAGLILIDSGWSIDDSIDENGKFDIDVVVVVVDDVVRGGGGGVGVLFISQNIFSKSLIDVSSYKK